MQKEASRNIQRKCVKRGNYNGEKGNPSALNNVLEKGKVRGV